MTVYYVQVQTGGGSPAGAGTLADPWNGLDNIDWAGTVTAGDVVDLQGLTHTAERLHVNTTGGSAGSLITVQNGTIDSTSLATGTQVLLNATTEYIRLKDLTLKAWGGGTTDNVCYGIRASSGGGNGCEVIGCELDGTNAGGVVTNRAITIGIDGASDYENLLFKDNKIHDCDYGIACQRTTEGEAAKPTNARVIGNSFWNMPGRCIWFYMDDGDADGSEIAGGRTAPNLKITDNTIVIDTSLASGSAPINFRGSVDGVVARNYIKDAGADGTVATVNAINPGADTDLIIEDNTVINVLGTGAGDGNGIITDFFKVATNESNGVIVRRNWIEGCNADAASGSLSIWKSVDGIFTSNVLFDGKIGFKNTDNDTVTSGNLVRNNAVAGMDTQGIKWTLTAGTSTLNNNALHTTGDTCVFIEGGATNPTENYNCFNGYSNKPMLDGVVELAIGANSVDGDMKYKDLTNGDLRLDGDSPCIATGTKWWTGAEQGQDGLRFYATPSMGAYEYRPGRSGYARKAAALVANTLDAGVDIAKAKAA